MGKFTFNQYPIGGEVVLKPDTRHVTLIINSIVNDSAGISITLDTGNKDEQVGIDITRLDARKLAGILQYFADIGELPANFEALQD